MVSVGSLQNNLEVIYFYKQVYSSVYSLMAENSLRKRKLIPIYTYLIEKKTLKFVQS